MKQMQKFPQFFLFVVSVYFIASHVSCSQYDYSSPLPGVLDIRLRTVSDTSKIPFSSLNSFNIKIAKVIATRNDLGNAPIYSDLRASKRDQETNLNTLSPQAKDSSLVLGQSYVPPGDYIGIEMSLAPGPNVLLDGYRTIIVNTLPDFDPILKFHSSFHVDESRATKVVLTINLDSSLVPQSDGFIFKPFYYISSIQYQ